MTLTAYGSRATTGTLSLCFNVDPSGKARDAGESLVVQNVGNGPASKFGLYLGIFSRAPAKAFWCPSYFEIDGLESYETASQSSFCCTIGLAPVPVGTYEVFAWVDPYKEIAESDEDNNILFKYSLYLP